MPFKVVHVRRGVLALATLVIMAATYFATLTLLQVGENRRTIQRICEASNAQTIQLRKVITTSYQPGPTRHVSDPELQALIDASVAQAAQRRDAVLKATKLLDCRSQRG
jgi:hypothetical protein